MACPHVFCCCRLHLRALNLRPAYRILIRLLPLGEPMLGRCELWRANRRPRQHGLQVPPGDVDRDDLVKADDRRTMPFSCGRGHCDDPHAFGIALREEPVVEITFRGGDEHDVGPDPTDQADEFCRAATACQHVVATARQLPAEPHIEFRWYAEQHRRHPLPPRREADGYQGDRIPIRNRLEHPGGLLPGNQHLHRHAAARNKAVGLHDAHDDRRGHQHGRRAEDTLRHFFGRP